MAYTNFTDKIITQVWGAFRFTSAEALKAGDLVTSGGYMADEDDAKAAKWVATEDIASGDTGWLAPAVVARKASTIATGGAVTRGDHSGTAGDTLYLSTTDGAAHHTVGSNIAQVVGYVLSQDEIYLCPTAYLTGTSLSITGAITTTTTGTFGTTVTCSSQLTAASNVTFSKKLTVGTLLTASSKATLTKAVTCSSALTTTKTLTASSNTTLTKAVTCSSAVTSGRLFTASSKCTLTKKVSCSSDLAVAKGADFSSDVSIALGLTCSSQISAASNATFSKSILCSSLLAGFRMSTHDASSNVTVTATMSGRVFTNDTDAKVYTLPATAAGLVYTFVNIGASTAVQLKIAPNAVDKILMSPTTATDNKAIVNTKATMDLGDSITLCGDPTGDGWLVIAKTGIWATT